MAQHGEHLPQVRFRNRLPPRPFKHANNATHQRNSILLILPEGVCGSPIYRSPSMKIKLPRGSEIFGGSTREHLSIPIKPV
jgi:hypothetical protein